MRVALLLQGLALAFLASSLGQEDHFGIAGWPRAPNSRAATAPSAPPEWARECRPSGGGAQSAVRGSPAPLRF